MNQTIPQNSKNVKSNANFQFNTNPVTCESEIMFEIDAEILRPQNGLHGALQQMMAYPVRLEPAESRSCATGCSQTSQRETQIYHFCTAFNFVRQHKQHLSYEVRLQVFFFCTLNELAI